MNENAMDVQQQPQKKKIVAWYENKSSVFIALLFFWPLGIYALAKNVHPSRVRGLKPCCARPTA